MRHMTVFNGAMLCCSSIKG